MAPHQRLLTYVPDDPRRLWDTGVKFSSDPNARPHKREPVPPIKMTINGGDEGAMKDLWEAPATVMSKRLGEALRSAGVANIDEYEAVIEETNSGETHSDYVAFNLVGLVAATDHANSEYDAEIRWFDKLALEESAPREALMFRLKDATYNIVVHERVKKHLEDAGFDSLEFIDPEEVRAAR